MQRPQLPHFPTLPPLPGRAVVWLTRISVTLALIFFSAAAFLLWALQTGRAAEAVRTELVRGARDSCGVALGFEDVRLSLFPPSIDLGAATLSSTMGVDLIAVQDARVRVRVLPLLYGRIQLAEVRLKHPTAAIELGAGRTLPFPRCLSGQPRPESTGRDALMFGVDQVAVEDGVVSLAVSSTLSAALRGIGVTLESARSAGTELSLTWTGGEILHGSRAVSIGPARVRMHVAGPLTAPRALTVQALRASIGEVTVEGSGVVDLVGPVYEAKVEVNGPIEELGRHFPEFPELGGRVRVAASVAGTLTDPRVVAELTLEGVTVGDYGFGDQVDVELIADRRRVDVGRLAVKLGAGTVRGTLRVEDLDTADPRVEGRLQLRDFSLARVLHLLNERGAWVDFAADGEVTVDGGLRPLALGGKLDLVVKELQVWDASWDAPGPNRLLMLNPATTTVLGRWRADPRGFDIEDATLTSARSVAKAKARVNPSRGATLDIEAEFANLDFADLGPIAGLPFAGHGPLSLKIKGPTGNLRGEGRFSFDGFELANRPFGHVEGPIVWHDDDVLDLESLKARLGESSYEARVGIDLGSPVTLRAKGQVTDGRLQDLLTALRERPEDWGRPSGRMVGTFDLAGPPDALSGPIEGRLSAIEVVGERAESGDVHGRFEDGAVVLEDVRIHKRAGLLRGSVRVAVGATSVDLDVHTDGLRLQHLDALRATEQPIDGPIEVAVALRGPWGANSGTIALSFGELTLGAARLGGGVLRGPVQAGVWRVKGSLGGDTLSTEAEVQVSRNMSYKGQIRARALDLPGLLGGLMGRKGLVGSIDGRADLEGSLVEWRDSAGTLVLDRAKVEQVDVLALELDQAARATLRRRTLELRPLTIVGPGLKLALRGRVGADTALGVQGQSELTALPGFFPLVERSSGLLVIDATIEKSATRQALLGSGRVERGNFLLAKLPGRFTGARAQLRFSDENVILESAEARYEGGEVTGTGQLSLEGATPKALSFAFELLAVRPSFSYPRFDFVSTFTGHLELGGPYAKLRLSGHLDAARSILRPKFEWRSAVGAGDRPVDVVVYDPAKENLELAVDLGFPSDDPVQLRNETASVDLSGDVTLSGTNQRIGMVGAMAVGRGRAGFLGREYVIEGGTIDLRDRFAFQPSYDLSLSARACDASIRVGLVGTLQDFKTSFQSRPEMEETNVVSCLLRGIRIRDLENIRGDSRGNLAASFAGEALWRLSGVDQEVRRVLPVDQIEVTSEYSARDRVYEPRILVAKELGEGVLRLEYSSSLLRNDTQRAAVRYRVTPRLTLQYGWMSSEDVTIGDHGVDLRYRWEW